MQQCPKLVMLSTAMVRSEDLSARVVCMRPHFLSTDFFIVLAEDAAEKRRAHIIE
jgi:hypothetical protein